MNTVVVIPTYNERDNITQLIKAVNATLSTLPSQGLILIVDDNSPDGTADVVRINQITYPNLHLLTGPHRGLGDAYVRGIRYAFEHLAPTTLIQMDADFSHAPHDIPRLLASLEQGADLAIGSRYLGGNRTPLNWGWHRRSLSWSGNLISRHWLGLAPIQDCTAGFRAWKVNALRHTNFSTLNVQGYTILVAMLQRAVKNNCHIKEVEVDFPDRTLGESKLGWKEMREFALWAIQNPYYQKRRT